MSKVRCSRCGETVGGEAGNGYNYCDDCRALFDEIREEGVFVRSRHGNREFKRDPYVAPSYYSEREAQNQVEALACAKIKMEETGSRGLFIYQKSGSKWLISEYLDAHPGIAADVDDEIERIRGEGDSSGGLRSLLPV